MPVRRKVEIRGCVVDENEILHDSEWFSRENAQKGWATMLSEAFKALDEPTLGTDNTMRNLPDRILSTKKKDEDQSGSGPPPPPPSSGSRRNSQQKSGDGAKDAAEEACLTEMTTLARLGITAL